MTKMCVWLISSPYGHDPKREIPGMCLDPRDVPGHHRHAGPWSPSEAYAVMIALQERWPQATYELREYDEQRDLRARSLAENAPYIPMEEAQDQGIQTLCPEPSW